MAFTLPTSGTDPKTATKGGLEGAINDAIALAGITILEKTWDNLSDVTGARDGQPAAVSDGDTGTHTDPVVGGTVENAGSYAWRVASGAWERIGSIGDIAAASAASNAAQTALDREATGIDVVAAEAAAASAEAFTEQAYSSVSEFKPNIIAREPGYHCAFGSIARVKYLNNIGLGNINLVVYRRGLNHQDDGIIRGVYVTDDATSAGEPFTIASQEMFPNIGRGGVASPNDFRDPNLLLLPDGRVLLTFFAINFEAGDVRTQYESYAMVGTFDETYRHLNWSAPSIMLDFSGMLVYGKPIVVDDMVYMASYTGGWTGDSGPDFEYYVLGAPLADLTSWSVVGVPFLVAQNFAYSEPILRPRPEGGYFIQIRHESGSGKSIRRMDADSISGPWTAPATIFEGSSHAKGLEFMSGGLYFTGVRYLNGRPGVAILATETSAASVAPLNVAGVVMSSYLGSGEASYVEFTKIGTEEWLGMCHTDAGRTIECWRFTDAMIRNKRIKTDTAFPGRKRISAGSLDTDMHIGFNAARTQNLISNPLLHTPYGIVGVPGWSGATPVVSDGLEVDGPGAGYAKVSTSGGTLTHRIPAVFSKIFARESFAAAVRIYCKTPDRVRVAFTFGASAYSLYHEGKGWQTLRVVLYDTTKNRALSAGTSVDLAAIGIQVSVGASLIYYVDWATAGFGQVIPEPVNEAAMRMSRTVRLSLPNQTNTFNLVDLGFPVPAPANFYVSLLQSLFDMRGYRVSTTTTTFTITLADGSLWGGSAKADFEIKGV